MKASQTAQRASARAARRKKKAEANASQKIGETTTLRQTAAELIAQGDAAGAVDLLAGIIDDLRQDNERLNQRLKQALIARFGRSSERLSKEELGQLVLAFGGTQEQAAEDDPPVPVPDSPKDDGTSDGQRQDDVKKKRKSKHKGRRPLDPRLPRHIHEVPIPAEERSCNHCGKWMEIIGHVDHEWVEYEPARLEVHVERRQKCACGCREDINVAPRLPLARTETRAGASVMAELLESKCDDALPVYRQRDKFGRLGFQMPMNTTYGYWNYGTALVQPVGQVTVSSILADFYLGIDDTRLDYLDKDAPNGKRRGHLWCMVGTGPLVGFVFTPTWRAEDIAAWLLTTTGFIQCDDYGGYASMVTGEDGHLVQLVPDERRLGCLMHVRRYFHAAYKLGDVRAAVPLKYIADIYAIEARAKKLGMGPGDRLALRCREAIPILDAFDTWVDTHADSFLPSSKLATAVGYAQNQRPFVRRCFEDGRFEIDNGEVERQIREPAVGRKNFLFSGSASAAGQLAGAYTLVMSARRLGISVREYLVDIIIKLDNGWPLRRINELRPDVWARNRGLISAE